MLPLTLEEKSCQKLLQNDKKGGRGGGGRGRGGGGGGRERKRERKEQGVNVTLDIGGGS